MKTTVIAVGGVHNDSEDVKNMHYLIALITRVEDY